MRVSGRVIVIALLGVAAACSSKTRTAAKTDAGASAQKLMPSAKPIALPSVAKQHPATVKLLQPGAEPRRLLRYRPALGASQKLTLKSTYALAINSGEHKMFSRSQKDTVALTLTVTKIAANGDVHLNLNVREVESKLIGPNFDRPRKKKQFKGTAVISARAKVLDVDIPGLEQAEDKRDLLSLTDYFYPLPEAAVGVGARWEVHSTYVRNGMTMRTVDTHTLVTLNGDNVTTNQRTRQLARPQLMSNMATGPLALIETDIMDTKGSGTTRFHLNKPAFASGETKFRVSADMRNRQASKVLDMRFNMSADLRMEAE